MQDQTQDQGEPDGTTRRQYLDYRNHHRFPLISKRTVILVVLFDHLEAVLSKTPQTPIASISPSPNPAPAFLRVHSRKRRIKASLFMLIGQSTLFHGRPFYVIRSRFRSRFIMLALAVV